MPFRKTFMHTSSHKSVSTYRHAYSGSRQMNMTEGKVFGKVAAFVLPLVLTNLLQTFYNAADMVVVSMSSEANAVGAIGMTGAYISLVLNVFMGFATGANVVVARHLGARNKERTEYAVHTAVLMSMIFGVISTVLGLLISRSVLSAMGASGKLLELATRYTYIYFAGAPFVAVTNYLIAIYRAKGDTKTPLMILSFSGIVNVLFNLFFVLVVGLSVEGVSIATAIANMISAVLLGGLLMKDKGDCHLSLKKLRLDKASFRDILYVGIPAGLQGSLFAVANMVLQSSIISVNNALFPPSQYSVSPVVNGNAAATNLEGFAYNSQNAVYQAAISFTSQNVGADKPKRVPAIMGSCYTIGFIISGVMALAMFLLREPLLGLYGVVNSSDPVAQAEYGAALMRIKMVILPYLLVSFMEVGCGITRGLGKAISSTVVSLVGVCGLRLLWVSTVFAYFQTLESIYICLPVSWVLTGTVFLIFSISVVKKMIAVSQAKAAMEADNAKGGASGKEETALPE